MLFELPPAGAQPPREGPPPGAEDGVKAEQVALVVVLDEDVVVVDPRSAA